MCGYNVEVIGHEKIIIVVGESIWSVRMLVGRYSEKLFGQNIEGVSGEKIVIVVGESVWLVNVIERGMALPVNQLNVGVICGLDTISLSLCLVIFWVIVDVVVLTGCNVVFPLH